MVVLVGLFSLFGLFAVPSGAADDVQAFLPGLDIEQASVTGPSLEEPLTISADAANAFMRSWFAASIIPGKVEKAEPPAGAPVYRMKMRYSYGGTLYEATAWYAVGNDGTYVGMPAGDIVPGLGVPSDAWIKAPEASVKAIHDYHLPTAAAAAAGAAVTTPTSSSSSDEGVPWLPIVIALAVTAVVVAGIVVWRARRSRRGARTDSESDASPAVHV